MKQKERPSEADLFAMDFLLSIGGEDTPETREMSNTLNLLTGLWGHHAKEQMIKFLHLVKSRTDELALTLQAPAASVENSSETRKNSDGKNKRCETEKRELQQRLKECETKLSSAQKELAELRAKGTTGSSRKDFDALLAAYNSKCIELDGIRDESVRHSIWYTEQISTSASIKSKLEIRLNEKDILLKELGKNEGTSPTRKFLRNLHTVGQLFHSHEMIYTDTPHNTQVLINPSESERKVCFVPTCNGRLVSLRDVYTSWKQNGIAGALQDHVHFPAFRVHSSSAETTSLMDPRSILLFRTLFSELGILNEPPFKIQVGQEEAVSNQGEEIWTDIIFTDQIRVASVMYSMKHNQRDTNEKMVEHRIVQNNRMLMTISLEQSIFSFEIKEMACEPMKLIPSRLVVLDGSFELY